MPGVIPTNIAVIAQAIEQQILNFVSAVVPVPQIGDIRVIRWINNGTVPPPSQIGQRDILIEFQEDRMNNFEGDGRYAMNHTSINIWIRSSLALDSDGTRRDWFIIQEGLEDSVSDAMDGFFPVDNNQNALTIAGLVPKIVTAEERSAQTQTWGYAIGNWEIYYFGNRDRTIL